MNEFSFSEALATIDPFSWIIMGVMIVCGILLLMGKGDKLLGENIAKGRENEDPKKYGIVTGAGLLILAILTFILSIGRKYFTLTQMIIGFAACVAVFILMVVLAPRISKKK